MRPELERLFLIEQQLLNGPAARPAAEWQLCLLLDGELAADTAVQQQLHQGLCRAGRHQLRRELAVIHAQLYGTPSNRWRTWVRRFSGWLRADPGPTT